MKPIFAVACLCLTLLAGCKSDGGGGDGGGGGGGNPPLPDQPDAPENTATNACEFGIGDIPARSSRVFDCVLDLEGQTFDVASGVSLAFDKGDIRNGTLRFDGGRIDGRLMNSSLTIAGNVDLISEVFDFYPERWEIRQRRVNDTQALSNRDKLEAVITQTHRMDAEIFRTNRMDAYFNVTPVPFDASFQPEFEAINIPFAFTLQMTDHTHLRVQPNSHPSYALLASTNTYSVHIQGGNLYGDRAEHTYTAGSTHEWGYLVYFFGVQAGNVKEATLQGATGDAIKVQNTVGGRNMSFFQSNGNTFDNNRRNHISVTSCFRVGIFNNIFRNASVGGSGASAGVGPGHAIDLHASRTQNPDGTFIEKVSKVRIIGNTESNSRGGSIAVTHADEVEVFQNDLESGVSYKWATRLEISNNEIIAPSRNSGVALRIGEHDALIDTDSEVPPNVVARNTVSGFDTGIRVSGNKAEVIRNTVIEAAQGLVLDRLSDSKILGTTINSVRPQSVGIVAEDTVLKNVTVDGSIVLVASNPLRFSQVNNGAGQGNNNLNILNNSLRSDTITLLDRVVGVDFEGNQLSSGLELRNVSDTALISSKIRTDNDNGIHLRQTNTNITIRDSRINVASDKECIVIDPSTSSGEVTQQSNLCEQEIDYPRPGIAITEIPYPEIPDTSYTIELARWDIPSDRTDPVKTNQNLQAAVDWARDQGYGTVRFPAGHFLIGELGNSVYYSGLRLSSNTAYLLDANTIIEMTPNDKWNYCLLEVGNRENVVISGGQLRGDRDAHIFTPRADGADAHDEGHLICLEGSGTKNITIHSTIMRNATGDGVLFVGGRDGAPSVDNVDIINNDIGYNRRQGISFVGATNVRVEDNEIHHINGTAPQFGIDFEGRTNRDVQIRNNHFHHNRGGDIVNTDGRNVLIENNILEQGAGSSYIDGPLVYWKRGDMTVRYNEITMTSQSVNNWNGIIMYSSNTPKTNPATTYIYENVCNGCGMYMYYGADLEIRDNLLYNGHIALKDFRNVTITNNRVIRSRAYCWPYRFLRVRGRASGNILDDAPFDIPLSPTSDYEFCWI